MTPKKTKEETIPIQKVQPNELPMTDSPLWTIDEVASYLQLTPETVRAMARQQEIPAFKIRRRWRFRKEDIELWVNSIAQHL